MKFFKYRSHPIGIKIHVIARAVFYAGRIQFQIFWKILRRKLTALCERALPVQRIIRFVFHFVSELKLSDD